MPGPSPTASCVWCLAEGAVRPDAGRVSKGVVFHGHGPHPRDVRCCCGVGGCGVVASRLGRAHIHCGNFDLCRGVRRSRLASRPRYRSVDGFEVIRSAQQGSGQRHRRNFGDFLPHHQRQEGRQASWWASDAHAHRAVRRRVGCRGLGAGCSVREASHHHHPVLLPRVGHPRIGG